MANKGQFKKTCRLTWHDKGDTEIELCDIMQRRFVPAPVYAYILEHKLLTDTKKGGSLQICRSCISKVKEHVQGNLKKQKTGTASSSDLDISSMTLSECSDQQKITDAVSIVANCLTNGILSAEQTKILACAISISACKELTATGSRNLSERLDQAFSTSYIDLWKELPDGIIKDILECVAKSETTDPTVYRKLVKCHEQLHWLADPKFISNVSMGEAMLLQQFSHSRYSVELLSKIIPSGSYPTMKRAMLGINTTEKLLPKNDVIFAFDNNQVIQRTWMVKFQGKQVVSAVTAVVFFDMGPSSFHQFNTSIPTALFPSATNRTALMERYKAFVIESDEIHRTYRKNLIISCINAVKDDCKKIGNEVSDSVSSGNCANVGFGEIFNYNRVTRSERNFAIHDMDCINVNPNSYATVQNVLDKILHYIEGSDRSYVPVVMDGSPFSMCLNVVRETHVCLTCCETVNSANLANHQLKHPNSPTNFTRKYRKIVIRPGNGHVEMTAVKSILSLFWVPFIKPIASLMGYSSENSLLYAKKGCDHHKSYNLLMIIFEAFSHELVYAYVKSALLKGETANYSGFCDWEKRVSQYNFTFQAAMDFTFTTLHSLHLFRSAVRMCNDTVALSARNSLSALFYIMNNTKYQEIICADTLYLLSLDTQTRRNVGIESACNPGGEVGEGFDFLLENRNKLYKSFLPNDTTPNFDQWLTVSRTTEDLLNLRAHAAQRLGMKLIVGEPRVPKLGNEVLQTRRYIRDLNMFVDKNLPLMSFEMIPAKLDSDAIMYVAVSRKNQMLYYQSYTQNEKISLPVTTISEVELDIKTATNDILHAAINSKIIGLREPFHSFYKGAMKKSTSTMDLFNLLKAVKIQMQNQIEKDLAEDMLDVAFNDDLQDPEDADVEVNK